MWLLRLLAVLVVIAIGVGVVGYVATGQKRFLDFAWRLFRYGIVFALLLFALMFLERVIVLPI